MFKRLWSQVHVTRSLYAAMVCRGLPSVNRFAVLCTIVVLGSVGVMAQDPATSFDQLNLILEKGDRITLVDASGNETTGRVNRLDPHGLDLKVSAKVQTFPEKDIQKITRNKPDSPSNGFLIGAGIGFGATLPINLGIAGNDEKGAAVAASALWGLIGGGIGALVDASIHERQLVFFRPRSNVSWGISPFYSDSPSKSQKPGAHAFPSGLPLYTKVRSSQGLRLTIRFR